MSINIRSLLHVAFYFAVSVTVSPLDPPVFAPLVKPDPAVLDFTLDNDELLLSEKADKCVDAGSHVEEVFTAPALQRVLLKRPRGFVDEEPEAGGATDDAVQSRHPDISTQLQAQYGMRAFTQLSLNLNLCSGT